jgi:hypothetical protein
MQRRLAFLVRWPRSRRPARSSRAFTSRPNGVIRAAAANQKPYHYTSAESLQLHKTYIVQLKSFALNSLSLLSHLCAPFIYCPSNLQYSEWSKTIKLGPGRNISLDGFGLWKVHKESTADTVHKISPTIFLVDLAQAIVGYQSGPRISRRHIRLPKRKRSWRRQPQRYEIRSYKA